MVRSGFLCPLMACVAWAFLSVQHGWLLWLLLLLYMAVQRETTSILMEILASWWASVVLLMRET